jgi:hypothetical protein
LNYCITYFEDALKQYEDFLVYAIIKDNYGWYINFRFNRWRT